MMVFVYGSLMRGGPLNDVFHGLRFLGEAVTADPMTMLQIGGKIGHAVTGFPAILPDPDGHPVAGELWEVDHATLRTLDAIEGVNRPGDARFYARHVLRVVTENLLEAEAFAYLWVPRPDDIDRLWVQPTDGVLDWRHHVRTASTATR